MLRGVTHHEPPDRPKMLLEQWHGGRQDDNRPRSAHGRGRTRTARRMAPNLRRSTCCHSTSAATTNATPMKVTATSGIVEARDSQQIDISAEVGRTPIDGEQL